MKKYFTLHKLLCICMTLLLFLSGCLGGYLIGKNASPTVSPSTDAATLSEPTKQALNLTIQPNSNSFFDIPTEETGGNFSECVQYRGVESVSIEIDGQVFSLEDALYECLVTEEEIFYLARTDARNGFCEEVQESKNGLAHFTFCYPEYNLRIIYDIYETPDGQQHLISDLCIYIPERDNVKYILGAYTDFIDKKTGYRLDREDWGIDLDIMEVSNTGLTLTCDQSGGQQFGQLSISCFELVNAEGFVPKINGSNESTDYKQPLLMQGETEFTIDWSANFGELPMGQYQLLLYIEDIYNESEIHPLSRNYHDIQAYTVEFSIS